MAPTPNKIWEVKASKIQQIFVQVFFFCKNRAATLTTTPCKLFYIIFVDIFFLKSLTHEKINRIRVFLT